MANRRSDEYGVVRVLIISKGTITEAATLEKLFSDEGVVGVGTGEKYMNGVRVAKAIVEKLKGQLRIIRRKSEELGIVLAVPAKIG